MQIVADGVPHHAWDTPTERIIERRRTNERRKPRPIALDAPVATPVEPWPAATPAWNRVLAISLAAFVCGALLATGVNRLHRSAAAATPIAQVEPIQLPTPPAAAAKPAAELPASAAVTPPPAVTVEPLPDVEPAPSPAPAPALVPPADDLRPRPERRPALVKATAAPRGDQVLGQLPGARPRRLAPAKPARATGPDPFGSGPGKKPSGPRQWVDPFAE